MKKVILCLLLLIPILVILTIDASGKLIASALVDIPVESVVIKHGGNLLDGEEVNLEEYKDTGKKYTVFCEVFPGIATDEMIWESSNREVAEIKADEKRKDAAEITFIDYGSVDIVCTSKKNSSITARATLYVSGLIPGYLTIGDYESENFESILIPRYREKSLLASVKPARSVKEEKIQWTSADPQIAKVDKNGVVTALREGETVVTASVTAKEKTVSASVIVKVEGEALAKQSVIYAAGETVDISPYLNAGVSAEGGSVVALSSLAALESVAVTLRKGALTESVRVVKLDSDRTLEVENYYALAEGALSSFMALGTSNIELTAFVPNGETPSYSWRSTDESILVVREGRVYAVGSGFAEVYPYAEGYFGRRIGISVTRPVEDFRLAETIYGDRVGLLQERVFGNKTLLNGQYTNTYTMKIASVFPAEAGLEVFTFESANTDIATVDNRGVITFAEDAEGKSVTVTASAYNQEGLPIRKSYTYHLVNGVNVGVGVPNAHFDSSVGEKPSFAPYADFKAAMTDPNVQAVVLHTDIYYPAKNEGGVTILNSKASLYGNGKKLDGQFFIDSVEDGDKLLLWDFSLFNDMPKSLNVSIVNANLQATQPTVEDAKEAFDELSARGGGAIGVRNAYPTEDNGFTLNAKGCLFQYAYGHVNIANGDCSFDGCIFRNNSASAIVLQQSSYGVANAKIKNCIFSNTIAPVGIACGNFDDILARFNGKKGLKSQFGKFELEGTNYVYNWKKLEEVQMDLLPRNLADSNANALIGAFNGVLGKVIREAFMMSDIDNLYVDENGDKWLNFSFLMIGVWENLNPQINLPDSAEAGIKVTFDPEQYQAFEVHADRAPSVSSVKAFARSIGVDLEKNKTYHIVCRDNQGAFNTLPGETYTIDKETYARLRGEAQAEEK